MDVAGPSKPSISLFRFAPDNDQHRDHGDHDDDSSVMPFWFHHRILQPNVVGQCLDESCLVRP